MLRVQGFRPRFRSGTMCPRIAVRSRPLLMDDGRGAPAQDELLDLAGRGLGELLDEVEPLRHLEMRQVRAGEFSKLLRGCGLTGFEYDESGRRLTPALVRKADHRHLLHGGMTQQASFDLHGGNVLPAADDDVLEPVAYLGVAVRVDDRGIAGVEPSVPDRLVRGLRITVVALEHHVAADHDLADRAPVVWDLLASFRVHDAQVAGRDQLHSLPRLDRGTLTGR